MKHIINKWFEQYFGTEEALLLTVFLVVLVLVVTTLGVILAPVFAALIIAYLLQGMINRLVSWKLPQKVSFWFSYLVFALGLVASLTIFIPLIAQQTSGLISAIPSMLAKVKVVLLELAQTYSEYITEEQLQELTSRVSQELANLAEQVLSLSISSFPGLASVLIYLILVPLLVFFMLKDKNKLLADLSTVLPRKREVMTTIWQEMDDQFSNYVRGKVIEILIIGGASYIAFLILGLNYAALLALLVGLSVLIPYVGATVVTFPVLLVGYFQWGFSSDFFWLFGVYGFIQFVDGNLLVPLLFSEVVNLHPIAIIVAILFFGGLWGFWGVFFAIPLATMVRAIYSAWPKKYPHSLPALSHAGSES